LAASFAGQSFDNDGLQAGSQAIMTAVGDIERQLRALVVMRLGADEAELGEETSLTADLGADSLDLVSLIIEIEEEFDIDIPDEDAMQIVTFRQLQDYVAFAAALKDIGEPRELQIPGAIRRH
jgi:acyl carrier protein